jgi:PAS domain S-box-containing protein
MPIRELLKTDLFTQPMVLVSVDGTIEAYNPAFAEQVGLDPNPVAGRQLLSLAALSAAAIEEYLKACANSELPLVAPVRLLRRDEVIPFKARAVGYPPRPGSSRVLLCLEAMREQNTPRFQFAQRPEYEESLRRQSQILEITLASIGDAVVVTDAEGRVSFMNAVAESLTEWSLEEALDQPLPAIFPIINEQTREPVPDPVTKVLQTGTVVGLANHTVLISRRGREIPIDDSAAPIRLPGGNLFGVVLIFRDITEQRRAEHTRAWLSAIVESSEDAIVSKRLDGTITSWNLAAERMFGHSAGEIIGKSITTIVPPELQAEELAILHRLSTGERVEHFDTVRLAKDGRRLDVSLTISPIRNDHGEIVGASKIARDITARKAMEQDLRDAERRKDEFLATLGHELRNPLAPIRNAAELLNRVSSSSPEAQTLSDILHRQISVLARLVDDLLDVSRVSSGHLQLHNEEVELVRILEDSIASNRLAAEVKGQTLAFMSEEPRLIVIGDRIRLTQVFSNLLRNANKYTPLGGRIEVHVGSQGDHATVRVRDNGIGISPALLENVFELFFQVSRTHHQSDSGLGIGLTLARQIVRLHGGMIEALSAGEGQGSEFVVRLPRHESSHETKTSGRAFDLPQRRRRVLIADDNIDAATTLAMLVRSMGHETFVAHDGLAALELAERERPDLAFLDLAMPTLDGHEVARRILEQPWGRAVTLVALTGMGQVADRERTAAAGFHHHFVKPAEVDRLRAVLADSRGRSHQPSGSQLTR